MKKVFALLLSVAMVICMMPSMAFAAVTGVTVTAAGDAKTVQQGETLKFEAAVTAEESDDKTVTWAVNGEDDQSVDGATIDNDGLLTVAKTVTKDTKLKVTAKAGDITSAAVTVTVTEAPADPAVTGVTVKAAGDASTVEQGTTLQFNATVTGDEGVAQTVTWKVTDESNADVDGATIDKDGLLSVAKTVAKDTNLKVTATSTADTSKSGSATVTVTEAPANPAVTSVTVAAAGKATTVEKGKTLAFTATVAGDEGVAKTVTWKVTDENGDAVSGATISAEGVLSVTADVAANTKLKVTATSTADETKSGTVTVTVIQKWTVAITKATHMSTEGTETQTVTDGTAIENVVYTAAKDYYFPENYTVAAQNGITVTRNSYTQITVSGTPTAAVDLTLTDATAKTPEDTPAAEFAASGTNSGTLSKVEAGMKYSIDGGTTWKPITGTTVTIDAGVTADNGIKVIKPATNVNTKLDSEIQDITVTKPAAPTTVTGEACTTADNNDGKLKNVANTMEYKKSDAADTEWQAGTGSDITGLTNGIYYVRIKFNGSALTSDYQIVKVGAFGAGSLSGTATIEGTAKYGQQLTAVTDAITGNTGTFSYQWKRVAENGDETNIGTDSPSYTIVADDIGKTIKVTVISSKEDGEITSAVTSTIDKADGPAAPTGLAGKSATTVGGADGKITGTTAAMEYSTDGTDFTSPTDCTEDATTVAAGTYYVRYAETDTHEAGAVSSAIVVPTAAVESVTVTPATPSVQKGGSQKFTAAVEGTDGITLDVTWTVEGKESEETTIGTDGTLTIGADETATTLTVKATSKADTSKSGTTTVTVSAGGGGGSYVPIVTDPLPTTKTESTNAVQNYVKPADYEDAEAAEIKAIMDKAAADIKNAKTEEEVKAIEAAAKAEIDKLDTAEEKAVIRTVEATKFKATSKRTTLNGKKAIKITWNKPAGVDFDGYDIYRSTKKNSGFGKKPFFTTTKQQYTNNKGLEAGKTYYYKVRGFKYVNGRKVYTEYSYKAIRTMK